MEDYILMTGMLFVVYAVIGIACAIVRDYCIYFTKLKEVEMFASKDYCMCGDLIDNHLPYSSDHAPVSEYDYYMSNIKLEIG